MLEEDDLAFRANAGKDIDKMEENNSGWLVDKIVFDDLHYVLKNLGKVESRMLHSDKDFLGDWRNAGTLNLTVC
jgi:hypothetical protein